MDALTTFGLLAVTAMLVFYALEDRTPWFILAFAAACADVASRATARTCASIQPRIVSPARTHAGIPGVLPPPPPR